MTQSRKTGRKTTLAALDEGVRAQCPAGGAVRGQVRSLGLASAPIGGVAAQIETLKGRNARSAKRGLLALVQPATNGARPSSVRVRAYDVGAPIRVSGAYAGAYAASLSTRGTAAWPSAITGDDETSAFAVEVFSHEASAPVTPAPVYTPPPVSIASAPVVPPPNVGVGADPAPEPVEIPVAAALSASALQDGLLGLELGATDDGDQFEREIQAILAGKTTRPLTQAPGPPPAMPAAQAVPQQRPHDVFEQMGRNMAYANAFNLPSMELGKRFDDIEREIASEESTAVERAQAQALELTDDDFQASLALAQLPAAAPAPPNAGPATTNPQQNGEPSHDLPAGT